MDRLLDAVHPAEAASGEPGEVKRQPVPPLVQLELHIRMDIIGDDAAVMPETVQLAVGDVEALGGFHAGADGAELDGVLVGVGVEHDSVGHGDVFLSDLILGAEKAGGAP